MRKEQKGPKFEFRYLLIDIASGLIQPLLNGPNAIVPPPSVAWSPDGRSLAVSNVFLPLDIPDLRERKARQENPFVAEIRLPSREIVPITDEGPDGLEGVRWGSNNEELFIVRGSKQNAYRKNTSRWQKIDASASAGRSVHTLKITLDEGLNTPPQIVALDSKTNQKVLLIDLNPQFKTLNFSKGEVITWTGTDGHQTQGGLFRPPDSVPGKRYPLVIQTHGFDPSRFYIDGPSTTAFAAQALAGKGFVVLQVGINKESDTAHNGPWNPEEGPRAMATYEGAVDYLDRNGLIDRWRVGLIGFSATCFDVQYALTHSKYQFAAASIADGIDGGYFQYIVSANAGPDITAFFDLMNGGPPFGSTLPAWLKNAPGFNMDRVQAPVRIEAHGAFGAVFMWEWLAGLQQLRKPVEMIIIPDPYEHVLQKPWDRIISQQGNVDWFSFWLKGEEDPDPTKAEQYARWRELRKLEDLEQTKALVFAN